jgi:hypothetical protein
MLCHDYLTAMEECQELLDTLSDVRGLHGKGIACSEYSVALSTYLRRL